MNKQKGLAPLIIVILIALAVGGYLIYQKQLKSVLISQPTFTPVASPVASNSAETAHWKVFNSKRYQYSFQYPASMEVINGGMGLRDITEESRVLVDYPGIKNNSYSGPWSIVAEDQDTTCPKGKTNISAGLQAFADRKWQLNKNDNNPYTTNKKVGDLTETIIAGQRAYQFLIGGSWVSECEGLSLNAEQFVVFTEKNGVMYTIMFPKENRIYSQILSTFKFTN